MVFVLILLFWWSQAYSGEILRGYEDHLLSWIKPGVHEDTLQFVIRRLPIEELAKIEDNKTRERAIQCRKAFEKGEE